ncbi:glycoside hydrolase family 99-like domain-containing protein [Vibrio tubiashii]|uniref:glycoside hydrolase family 99-like domain-containing protein n=1 Tax=Vibrio tubiashii TaxID=29498 RepID=UPI00234F908A|nr:glycoside hydrolase family 99-like domain-containing protein [Vibrio tubiashii]WCP67278.1 glycoside hydrolase family 99-like domain-containing protein [Vibrio tubiashii]
MKKELTNEELKEALQAGFTQAQGVKGWNVDYVPKAEEKFSHEEMDVKAIAYYLPQFHPIEENNKWWGKGFTEWTNVTKAVPQFLGHYQPRLPGEFGFYDLRLADNIREQAKLARHYGIYGFCIHHYWFDGHRLLETPVNLLLENKDIDINFCLCWANENWSRRWDGLDNDVLISQNHSDDDDIAFIESLFEAFRDPRYIRVENKPVLVLYRATLLPDAKKTVERWRERALAEGFDGIYVVAAKSFDIESPVEFGCDAAVEFPPHKLNPKIVTEEQVILNPDYEGTVYCYKDAVKNAKALEQGNYTNFRCVMPSWDNEARKPGKGVSFVNNTPEEYEGWLDFACKEAQKNGNEEKFVFINAWNEWAEGTHLEPCRRHGYRHLHITANTIRNNTSYHDFVNSVSELNSSFVQKSEYALIVHLYYEELLEEIIGKVNENKVKPDLFITLPKWTKKATLEKIHESKLNCYILPVDNRGRDIKPFLEAYSLIRDKFNYKACCKLHTKKSLHRVDGDTWRSNLYSTLLNFDQMSEQFASNDNLKFAAPSDSILDLSVEAYNLGNRVWLEKVLLALGYEQYLDNYAFDFCAGSMFWFKPSSLVSLNNLEKFYDSFEPELGQLDGTLAHSLERLFLLIATKSDKDQLLLLEASETYIEQLG